MNLNVILNPWLLAFNCFGDGLRDAVSRAVTSGTNRTSPSDFVIPSRPLWRPLDLVGQLLTCLQLGERTLRASRKVTRVGSNSVVTGLAMMTTVVLNGSDPASVATTRPNIVVLVADDLGYGDLSGYNADGIPTPHIDSLIRSGVKCTDGYVMAPVCNPSRAAIITGRYPQRWGHEFNPNGRFSGEAPRVGDLLLDQPTLAEVLHTAGYRTGLVGKWDLGTLDAYRPPARGFDEVVEDADGTGYLEASWPGVQIDRELGAGRRPEVIRNGRREPAARYLTEITGREAGAFIDRHRGRPFFLYVGFNAPHLPLQVTGKYFERFPDIENRTARIYAAMVSAMDDAVGVILRQLRESGIAENTLVILISDNGAPEKVTGASNAPLRGHKRMLNEGGIRVPFVVRWPGRLPAGAVCTRPVASVDIFATALHATGIRDERFRSDGVDLVHYITAPTHEHSPRSLFWRMGENAAVRRGGWKLLVTGDGRARLFDLASDCHEDEDVSASHPETVSGLRSELAAWQAGLAVPRWRGRKMITENRRERIEWEF